MFDTQNEAIAIIGNVIQLAMAPAFLLVAIGSMLQLFSGRLGRVVDRSRELTEACVDVTEEKHERITKELRVLDRRMTVVNGAILMGVLGAITVCIVVAMLFLMGLGQYNLTNAIAIAFILAMGSLTIGLVLFVIEVRLAERCIHVDRAYLRSKDD